MRHEVLLRTSSGRRSIIIDDDFCLSLGRSVYANRETVGLFLATWISLLSDSPLESNNKPYNLYKKFLHGISCNGLKATVVGYSDLAHKLVSQHTLMGSGSSIGDWIDDFKDTPVFFEYNRYYKTGDVRLLDFLYTFLNFGKKMEFVDPSFNEVAFRDWSNIEDELANRYLDPDIIDALRIIISGSLPPFSIDDARPKFGPGSVAERGVRGRICKIKQLQYDYLIDRFLFHGHIGMYGMGEDHGLTVQQIIPNPSMWTPDRGVSSRISWLIFRDKNLKVARSVCMEPNTLMYSQQLIEREFLRIIAKSQMSKFIDIRDQQRNRELSLFGSYTSEIDTLDLSAASDRLGLDLVKRIFPPSWLIPMLVTRSHSARLPDGTLRALLKFAPMGSALCFPTQCIVFASVCILSAAMYAYDTDTVDSAFNDWLSHNVSRVISMFSSSCSSYVRGFQPLAVYGDDICVDRRLTDTVKSILSSLGFVVNDQKSFTSSQSFRESCGGYYIDGHDITPLYFRVKTVRSFLSPNHVASQVHLINECFSKRYVRTYRFLIHSLMTWECRRRFKSKSQTKNSIPFVSDANQFGILCVEPKNSHLRSRFNKDYQRDEVRSWTITYDHKESTEDRDLLSSIDSYEHMRWWAGHTSNSLSEVHSSVARYDTGGSGLGWRWIPA